MKRFIRIYLLLAIFIGGPVGADTTGQALTDHLSANLPSCGQFEQKRWLDDLQTNLKSSGHFLRQDDALIWHTTTPVEDRVRLDPDNPDLPVGLKTMLPILNGLLSGDWAALQRHFDVTINGEPNAWQARLTPKNDALAERIEQINATGSDRLERLELPFVDGDHLTLFLTPADCRRLQNEAGRS